MRRWLADRWPELAILATIAVLVGLLVVMVIASGQCADRGGVVAGKRQQDGGYAVTNGGVSTWISAPTYSLLLDSPEGSCWALVSAETFARAENGDRWPRRSR